MAPFSKAILILINAQRSSGFRVSRALAIDRALRDDSLSHKTRTIHFENYCAPFTYVLLWLNVPLNVIEITKRQWHSFYELPGPAGDAITRDA